jgi:hypothetical protein
MGDMCMMANSGIYFCNDYTNMPIVPFFSNWAVGTPQAYALLCLCAAGLGFARHALARLRVDLFSGGASGALGRRGGDDGGDGAGLLDAALNAGAGDMLLPPADKGAAPARARGGGFCGSARGPLLPSCARSLAPLVARLPPPLARAADVAVYALVAAAGWLAMILVMSMNGGLLAAVIAGEALGVALFEPPGSGGGDGGSSGVSSGGCH